MHFLALTAAQHEELAADGWSFEHRLVGECTRRLFRNGDPSVVDGRLVAFLEASGEEAPLWKNMHEDGELEDLEFHEVKTARLNYRLKLAQPRGGVFAEDVSEFSIDEHLLSGPMEAQRAVVREYPSPLLTARRRKRWLRSDWRRKRSAWRRVVFY